jgi:SAF domain
MDRGGPGADAIGDETTSTVADPPRHRIRPRRPLPSGRAVVGGLLVALGMLIAFAVANGGRSGPTGRAVVATHAVRLGSHLSARDLTVEAVSLPSPVADQTFSSTDELVGAVALVPLAAGDVVEPSAVALGGTAKDTAELSFPVDRNRALDGVLQVGERLDVLATYGTGETARTVVVARSVELVDVDDDSHGGLESTGKVVVTIELPHHGAMLPVVHATEVAAVTLVRSDDHSRSGAGTESYSLPPDVVRPSRP